MMLLPFKPYASQLSDIPWPIGACATIVGLVVVYFSLRGAARTTRFYALLGGHTDDEFETAWSLFEERRKQQEEDDGQRQPLTDRST
jgi:hypothetical protein